MKRILYFFALIFSNNIFYRFSFMAMTTLPQVTGKALLLLTLSDKKELMHGQ